MGNFVSSCHYIIGEFELINLVKLRAEGTCHNEVTTYKALNLRCDASMWATLPEVKNLEYVCIEYDTININTSRCYSN